MNEENLIMLDAKEEPNIKNLEEPNFIELPASKSEVYSQEKREEKTINTLPSWSIEPPIEIRRGE